MTKSAADQIRDIAKIASDDAANILQLIALIERQNTGGTNKTLSEAGAGGAAISVRNAMIAYLVLLISRTYAAPKPGDRHLCVAVDLLKTNPLARSIFEVGDGAKKVAAFEAHWSKCKGDHRLERIKHFRDKFTAHLGEPKDVPNPVYSALFAFGRETVKAIALMNFVTNTGDDSITDDSEARQSADAFWNPREQGPAPAEN